MSMPRNVLAASLAALLPLVLAACAPDAGDADTRMPDATEAPAADAAPAGDFPAADVDAAQPATVPCNADAVQSLVGQASSDAVIEQARADSGASSVRALKPGDAATMDYREDRLNIELDADGVIQSLRCG